MNIRLKRAYESPAKSDGTRVLVDRLWPRGLTKERAAIDLWLKEIAPSPELRKWFAHDPDKWSEFQSRYNTELRDNAAAVEALKSEAKKGAVTLVYAARDEVHNEARVLERFLKSDK